MKIIIQLMHLLFLVVIYSNRKTQTFHAIQEINLTYIKLCYSENLIFVMLYSTPNDKAYTPSEMDIFYQLTFRQHYGN
ncbi:hypothetical protein C7H79_08285 [Nitrosomonas supralitoralis]|uniref:Uncharacterized protein n=1 Tax=Nitrosomonas supralitoralis TaxID=2116706 RepID=A0A2P7NV82_9PROT|nr:hypothetical protein C7H79_08285 [Nitrosomonas supralitoralis]